VALDSWLDQHRARDWSRTLRVVIYPINGDGSTVANRYIRALQREDFLAIEDFFRREGLRYELPLRTPLDVQLAPEIQRLPPELPPEASPLATLWWSLQLRHWAWRHDTFSGPSPQARLFVLYYDPRRHPRLDHSVGLEKGMLGVIKDKYDPRTNHPLYPQGYADPERQPLHPQQRAEIMGGRIPLSEGRSVIPASLAETVVGPATAAEIHSRLRSNTALRPGRKANSSNRTRIPATIFSHVAISPMSRISFSMRARRRPRAHHCCEL